jgi:hypothetical protein
VPTLIFYPAKNLRLEQPRPRISRRAVHSLSRFTCVAELLPTDLAVGPIPYD